MKISILAFGIAKDILGGSSIEAKLDNDRTVAMLKNVLETRFPKLKKLATYMIAVNSEYATDDLEIKDRDEIAIIPPVSGG